MGVVRKTISVSEEQDAWVKAQVASGKFTNDSEVHRALIRQFQEIEKKRAELRSAIQEGLESGVSDLTIDEMFDVAVESWQSDA